jgi:hypothetical protein
LHSTAPTRDTLTVEGQRDSAPGAGAAWRVTRRSWVELPSPVERRGCSSGARNLATEAVVSGPVGRRRTARGARWRAWENPWPVTQASGTHGALGVTARLFRDPDGSNRVGMFRDPRYRRLPGAHAGRSVTGRQEARRCSRRYGGLPSRRRDASSVIGATEDGADFHSMNLLANAKRESPRPLQSAASMISNTLV